MQTLFVISPYLHQLIAADLQVLQGFTGRIFRQIGLKPHALAHQAQHTRIKRIGLGLTIGGVGKVMGPGGVDPHKGNTGLGQTSPEDPGKAGNLIGVIGRIRRWLPRKTDLTILSDTKMRKTGKALNTTPRK